MTSFGAESQCFLAKRVETQGVSQEGLPLDRHLNRRLSDYETRETLAIVTNLGAFLLRPAGREDKDK